MDLSSLMRPSETEDEPAMPIVHFTSEEQLFREIDATMVDSLLVTNVSPTAFGMLERKREASGRKFLFSSYDEDSRLLLVSVSTAAHVQLHIWLYYNGIYDSLRDMGHRCTWRSKGATSYYYYGELRSGSSSSSGEADSSGGPLPERRGPGAFPTVVIEAGCCRSLAIMQAKAKWWFRISSHDVKIVLLAKLYESQRRVILERWEERPRGVREGATTTRWGSEWVPSCQQEIIITETSRNPPVYHATGDLVLSFRLLCLREPGEGERDVVVSVAELQEYAQCVWEEAED